MKFPRLIGCLALLAVGILLVPANLQAAVITCPDPIASFGRQFALGDATGCTTGSGNATVVDVNAAYGPGWTERDSLTSGDPAIGIYLTVTSGSWGGSAGTVVPDESIAGTWSIGSSFWAAFAEGVISVHVGNGAPGDINSPDHFIFPITASTESGTWTYIRNLGNGGGLSNFKLYSRGLGDGGDIVSSVDEVDFTDDTSTPEPGTLLLLGLAIGLGTLRAQRRSLRS